MTVSRKLIGPYGLKQTVKLCEISFHALEGVGCLFRWTKVDASDAEEGLSSRPRRDFGDNTRTSSGMGLLLARKS